MKIKNTKELQLRADSHARNDHILQGTYGKGNVNGHIEFKGCAVGCLSTPHRKKELRDFLRKHLNRRPAYAYGPEQFLDITEGTQREMLAKEFGITEDLAVLAEGIFEVQETHGAAINFVRDFAKALVEGSDIRPRDVHAYMRKNLNGCGLHYADIMEEVEIQRDEYEGDNASAVADTFLNWLRKRPVAK